MKSGNFIEKDQLRTNQIKILEYQKFCLKIFSIYGNPLEKLMKINYFYIIIVKEINEFDFFQSFFLIFQARIFLKSFSLTCKKIPFMNFKSPKWLTVIVSWFESKIKYIMYAILIKVWLTMDRLGVWKKNENII